MRRFRDRSRTGFQARRCCEFAWHARVPSRPASAQSSRMSSATVASSSLTISGGQSRSEVSPQPRIIRPRSKAERLHAIAQRCGRFARGLVLHQLDADHQPAPAHVADHADGLASSRAAAPASIPPTLRRVGDAFALQDVHRRQRRGDRNRIAAERRSMRAGHPVHDLGAASCRRPAACRWRCPWPCRPCPAPRRSARWPTTCRCVPRRSALHPQPAKCRAGRRCARSSRRKLSGATT